VLIAMPSLSILGTWLLGTFPLFQLVAMVLVIAAIWDWRRFFDKSRTMLTIFGLSIAIVVSAVVAMAAYRPPVGGAAVQSVAMISCIALALTLVQLYRGEATVLTVIRGWMYAVAILGGITVYQRVTQDLPALSGPFPTPGYLAGSMVAGIFLMPVGFALEKDHRLRWAYPVIAVVATWVVWTTHRSVGFAVAVAILLVWLALERWTITAALVFVAGVVTLIFRPGGVPLRWADVGMEPPLDATVHSRLLDAAWTILRDSHFLGVGPGGLASHWPDTFVGYRGPYSALMEIASQYGAAVGVVLMCALIGAVAWCGVRLWQTRGGPLRSVERAPAFWLALVILTLPITTSLQAQWLNFPLSALVVATLALLARHIESPQGRALVWSAGPGAAEETAGPPDHGDRLDTEPDGEEDPTRSVGPGRGDTSP